MEELYHSPLRTHLKKLVFVPVDEPDEMYWNEVPAQTTSKLHADNLKPPTLTPGKDQRNSPIRDATRLTPPTPVFKCPLSPVGVTDAPNRQLSTLTLGEYQDNKSARDAKLLSPPPTLQIRHSSICVNSKEATNSDRIEIRDAELPHSSSRIECILSPRRVNPNQTKNRNLLGNVARRPISTMLQDCSGYSGDVEYSKIGNSERPHANEHEE